MSGICGIIGRGDIEEMTRIQAHRGPDDLGFYLEGQLQIGAQRLAIVDIPGGHQPMSNEDQKVWAVLDGDIFNWEELRKELEKAGHTFRSETDTEVVIHAWEEWGQDSLNRFNGQFAIALWDGKKLYLARDRMGEKPMYYYQRGGRFIFASEIKGLLTQVTATPRFSDEFRDFEAPYQGDTLFQNVRELPAASLLRFDGSDCRIEKWWGLSAFDGPYRKEKDYVEEMRSLLEDSVKLRLKGDVPVGAFISGGLDSAIIACLARPEHLYSVSFRHAGEAYDEFSSARMVAEKINAKLHVVRPRSRDLRDLLQKIVWHQDFPVGSMSSIASFMTAAAAARDVKAVLVGQGADELFGGHTRYLMMLAEDALGREPALNNYLPLARYFWSPQMFSEPPDRYYTLINRGPGVDPKCRGHVRELFSHQHHLIDKMGYADLFLALPTVLHMDDRATAAFGIENRNPFLDHRLIEFAFRLPPRLKVEGFQGKVILRKAMKGIVPRNILERPDKMGLAVPIGMWFRQKIKRWADVRIKRFRERYEANFLNAAWDAAGGRGEFDRKDYMRVCLELWIEAMVETNPSDWDQFRLTVEDSARRGGKK